MDNLNKISKTSFEMEKKSRSELIEEIECLSNLVDAQHNVMHALVNKKHKIHVSDMVINSLLGTILAVCILKLLDY
jgi:hypothetical protein